MLVATAKMGRARGMLVATAKVGRARKLRDRSHAATYLLQTKHMCAGMLVTTAK